jgi:hypothetical protein
LLFTGLPCLPSDTKQNQAHTTDWRSPASDDDDDESVPWQSRSATATHVATLRRLCSTPRSLAHSETPSPRVASFLLLFSHGTPRHGTSLPERGEVYAITLLPSRSRSHADTPRPPSHTD